MKNNDKDSTLLIALLLSAAGLLVCIIIGVIIGVLFPI
jgi:type III secretory pathway component EscS